jgi:hypothetical protein
MNECHLKAVLITLTFPSKIDYGAEILSAVFSSARLSL